MISSEYSKKEVEIFEGFERLIEAKIDISKVKVSDIAKAAKVGKGTVYEYFECKEEVIAKSIIYKLEKEFLKFASKCERISGFEEKCLVGYKELAKTISSQFSYFQIVLSNNEIHKFLPILNSDAECKDVFKEYMANALAETIELGIKEKMINPSLENEYIKNVFISVGGGIAVKAHMKRGKMTEEDIEHQTKISYELLIKALK